MHGDGVATGFNINPFGKNKDDDEDLDDGDGEEKGDHDTDDQGKTGRCV